MQNIFIDGIIFGLQSLGGISLFWREMLSRILKDPRFNVQLRVPIQARQNIFFQKLKLEAAPRLDFYKCPALLARFLPSVTAPKDYIFNSTYYRYPLKKSVRSIAYIYDWTYEHCSKGFTRWIHTEQQKQSILHADSIVCISEKTKQDTLELLPQSHNKKFFVLPMGYDRKSFYPLNIPFKKQMLCVGSRAFYKNFDKAVQAVALVPNTQLAIAGPPLRKNETTLLERFIPHRYRYWGQVSTDALNKLYNESAVLFYASEYEGFGIPLLEAMAAGCPVIALNKGAAPELIPQDVPMLKNTEPQVIAELFKNYADDLPFRKTCVQAGYQKTSRYSWKLSYEKLSSFLESS